MKFDVDKSLSRLSHISQILLVGFAIFGYFYTVRPIYQKEVLSENIAQKEVQLNKLNQEKDTVYSKIAAYEKKEGELLSNIESLQTQKNEIIEELKVKEYELSKIKKEFNKAKGDLELANLKFNEKSKSLKKIEINQREGMSDVYFENLGGLVSVHYLKSSMSRTNSYLSSGNKKKITIETIRKELASPYDVISKSLQNTDGDFIQANKNVPEKLKSEINLYIKNKIDSDKLKLSPDYTSLFNNINNTVAKCEKAKGNAKDNIEKEEINYTCQQDVRSMINDFDRKNVKKATDYIYNLRRDFK